MKRLVSVLLGLFLFLVVVIAIFASMGPAPVPVVPTAVTEVPAPAAELEVATEAISPSSAYARTLRGVFIKSIICTPARLCLGDSIDVQIKEAWLEKLWEPKSGGLFGAVILKQRRQATIIQGNLLSRYSMRFIGIYSGRIGSNDQLQAQLGIVWKAHVIDEIINQLGQ